MSAAHGNARSFVCPYHQWTRELNDDLAGLPFRDGVKEGYCVHGEMPPAFGLKDHSLTKLRVAVLHGSVFATSGLWRADQKSRMVMDGKGRHAVMISRRTEGGQNAAVTEGVTSFKANMTLHHDRLLDVVPEAWGNA